MRLVLLVKQEQRVPIIGVANLSNIVRGAFQAAHLGYSIDARHEGQGYMHEALEGLIEYVFEDLGLHRIMANYQPTNTSSARLLERLGFVKEGHARQYLRIAGEWQDHVLTSLIRPEPADRPR